MMRNENSSNEVLVEGASVFPAVESKTPPTSQENIDEALRILNDNKDAWVDLGIEEQIAILDQIKADLPQIIDLWMEKTIEAKGTSGNPYGQMVEQVLVAALFRMIRVLRRSLLNIKKYGKPKIPGEIRETSSGQIIVPSFPQTLTDKIAYQGVSGETWMQPGVSKDSIESHQARFYRKDAISGKVLTLLGAGSLGMIPVSDFLYKLFVEKKVVVLKMSPVNEYLGPLIEQGFSALIARGFLKVVYGGPEVGAFLCSHPLVNEIHITGSDKTFETILFGTGPEAADRKKNRSPLINKIITGELGNIGPVIIVPGDWNEDDIQLQGVRIASWLACNAGCNCVTPRLVIQHEDWSLREKVVEALGSSFDELPTQKAYYPGADQRHKAVMNAHPNAQLHGEPAPDHLPWVLIPDIDPGKQEDICFKVESFYSQIGETAISADSIPQFIERAVEFANNTLWGNLVATIIIHPKSLQDPQMKAAFERAVSELRYGTICINFFPGIAYTLRTAPFGPYPGNEISDIQSGTGKVNNFLMIADTQKAVFQAPFRNSREPTLFTTKNMDFGRILTEFEINPSWWNLTRLGVAQMRS